jgi:predicted carbohydrate-binding protein with CBM5 and CBM33 domain
VLPPIPNRARISPIDITVSVRAARRRLGILALATVVALLLVGLTATPAGAHGALESPVSRQAACGPEGGQGSQSEACAAAIALTGTERLEEWDNIRLSGVDGNDQAAVPDGQLCSAGLEAFAGLDAPRTDWPSTTLPSGTPYTFRYRATIPHPGTFRLYVTADGYDPTQPLTWSALEPEPFMTVTDPPLTAGAYTIDGQLPAGKTGQHLIYTVWQNSDSPDTYYSCSDVNFAGATAAGTATDTTAAQNATAQPTPGTSAEPAPQGASSAEIASEQNLALPWILGAAAVIALVALMSVVFRRSRW